MQKHIQNDIAKITSCFVVSKFRLISAECRSPSGDSNVHSGLFMQPLYRYCECSDLQY